MSDGAGHPGAAGLPAGPFELCGPLPGPGATVLEASAGTGKTHTIANLVTRFVAEAGLPIDKLLVVTFTRLATGELRQRTRDTMVLAEQALRRVVHLGGHPGTDPVAVLLATPPPGEDGVDEVIRRHQRLEAALANFDSATITTTHGFCHRVIQALGVWGDVAPGAALREDTAELAEQVVDDLYVRSVLRHGELPFGRGEAQEVGAAALQSPWTVLGPPADRGDGSPAGLRRRLAEAARRSFEERLRGANQLTYDGLLSRLAGALSAAGRGETACARLSERYRVVLVDEFQDTDLMQWGVVQRAFSGPANRLVLIGDPKQAVYSFRGADVYTYLAAAGTVAPSRRLTLDVNWRADASLVAGLDALLVPLRLGHPDIVYRRPGTPPGRAGTSLDGFPAAAPVRARLLPTAAPVLSRTAKGVVEKSSALNAVARDVARDIAALLGSPARLPGAQGGEGSRPVEARDIGVLVRTNRQAAIVEGALRAAGVPVVVSGAQSVLSTSAALDWLNLLRALEQPSSRSLTVAAALTDFFGREAGELALAGEEEWEGLHARLHQWAALLRSEGVASLFSHINEAEGLPGRLLGRAEGERRLTDLAHVSELLHAQATGSQLGLAALRAWLARHYDEDAPEGAQSEQRTRRLGSGDPAVQVLTVHRAKGLEFPLVYLPYLWDDGGVRRSRGGPVVYHGPAEDNLRMLDVGGEDGPVYQGHSRQALEERRGEDMRLVYVALTRARYQVVLWWARGFGCQHSALGRLLLSRRADGQVDAEGRSGEPRDEEVRAAFERLAGRAPGLVSVEAVEVLPRAPAHREPPAVAGGGDRAQLERAQLERQLDLGWHRASYTSVTRSLHAGRQGSLVTSEPEEGALTDEPGGQPEPGPGQATGPGAWDLLPGGRELGTFVHLALEGLDFSATDLAAEVTARLGRLAGRYPGEPADLGLLAQGLVAAATTPLGGPLAGTVLADLPPAQRVSEMSFELPVAGGERAIGQVALSDLAELLRGHLGPGDPLAGYPDALEELAAGGEGASGPAVLRGYLTGSLDLVFSAPVGSTARYFVADYKTNRLVGGPDQAGGGGPDRYGAEALAREMVRSHYPLQALFYLVALHRYLRWRLPGYRADRDLGGAVYLFLRGMPGFLRGIPGAAGAPSGPAHHVPGVFWWQPPAALVVEASDWLAGPGAPG